MSETIGWTVQVIRDDGSVFFCQPVGARASRDVGIATPVWLSRSVAVAHKDLLVKHDFRARVVKVRYTEPEVIGPKSAMKDSA